MKVTKWVDMGQEVDIEIGVDEIRLALSEAFQRIAGDDVCGEPNKNTILKALSRIGEFLNAFTPVHIALLNDKQKELVGNFLTSAAEKFKVVSLTGD